MRSQVQGRQQPSGHDQHDTTGDHHRNHFRDHRAELKGVEIVYAAKSLLTTEVARWVVDEGVGIGVGSCGELAVALAAGVDPAPIVLHGSAASVDELRAATAVGVGRVVVDSPTSRAKRAGRRGY